MPSEDVPAFILRAALGGYAVLTLRTDPSPEQRFSYHATRLLYQMTPGLREHLSRTFARESDLYIPHAGRISGEEGHILPPDLGLDARGQGTPWTPRDVIERGRAAASGSGDLNPEPAACIRLGLIAAARQHPLEPASLSEAQALALVRLALFDLGPAADIPPESLIDTVQERLWAALESHIEDDPVAFRRWFFDNIDNIVHAVAKQKRWSGPIPRDAVRQTLLELVFRSFRYVADCVHLQMTAFARALPDPLSEVERSHFDSLYRKQHYLGGLPFLLLHERFDFIRQAMTDVWESPSDDWRVGVVLRVLSYYGEMTARRREADRRYKARSRHRNDQNRVAQVLPLDPQRDSGRELVTDWFQEIAAVLRESRGASCRCGTTRHWRASLVADDKFADPIRVEEVCCECGHNEAVEIARATFEEAGRTILSGTRPGGN